MNIRDWWKERKAKKYLSRIPITGRQVDFRVRAWGHNISATGGRFAAWSTPSLRRGDLIITELGRFVVTESERAEGVNDMVFFDCISESKMRRILNRAAAPAKATKEGNG